MDDPLLPLRDNPISDEIIRPITELLLTELLVGSECATTIREFGLGMAVQGRRSLSMAWETSDRHSNKVRQVRSIQGYVRI
jgi:hypothetical protein